MYPRVRPGAAARVRYLEGQHVVADLDGPLVAGGVCLEGLVRQERPGAMGVGRGGVPRQDIQPPLPRVLGVRQ
jgi:hypothetical protein